AYGLKNWIEITAPASEDALVVELYSRQFDWTARYAGDDSEMGLANYTLISGTNPMGLATPESIEEKLNELDEEIFKLNDELENKVLPDSKYKQTKDKLGRRLRQVNSIKRIEKEDADK